MSEEQRQILKLQEPGSFDAHKNAAAPMIAMLGCLELDMEISDAGIETTESDDCRGVSRKDRDANGVLAATQEGARFSCKDRQKFIDLFTQSISGLCQMSQLYPRTKEQKESSGVTQKSRFIQSLVEKIMGKLAILEMILLDELSNKQRATREVADVFRW